MAAVMCGGLGYLEYLNWKEAGNAIHIAGCGASGVAAVGLLVYSVYFFKKTKGFAS